MLQSFPEDYEFVPPGEQVCIKTVGRLIGNAVPVDLGRAIAKSIVRHIGHCGVKLEKSNARNYHSARVRHEAIREEEEQ
jgi:DNA (cytosine-5)-methyltransferase 1